jgi:type IV pilus assembly protein PilA
MKTEFKAKFLQNLVSKKKGSEGFTLIELLVVIIIVGVLAAIALPSFLNQIGKARGSEAKSNIGTINRSQQAFRLEKGAFAGNLPSLDAKISGKFYSYVIGPTTGNATDSSVSASLAAGGDLKTYSGAVRQTAGTDIFGQVICESTSNGGVVPSPTAPIASVAAVASAAAVPGTTSSPAIAAVASVASVAAVASACGNGTVVD